MIDITATLVIKVALFHVSYYTYADWQEILIENIGHMIKGMPQCIEWRFRTQT